MPTWFPLREAVMCLSCESVWHHQPRPWQLEQHPSAARSSVCPACGSAQFRFLSVWLDRKEKAA